jgi:hypothetical protein
MVVVNEGDKVRLCGEALTRIGVESINSFGDGTRVAAICATSYEQVYGKCLASNCWSFSKTSVIVDPLADYHPDPKTSPWAYKFKLPFDLLNLMGVIFPNGHDQISMAYGITPWGSSGRLDSYSTAYAMEDGCLYANHGRAIIDYQRHVPETSLTNYPLFREYLVLHLALEFAISLGKPSNEIGYFKVFVDEAFHTAAAMDAKGSPVPFTNYSATIARMRSYG